MCVWFVFAPKHGMTWREVVSAAAVQIDETGLRNVKLNAQ